LLKTALCDLFGVEYPIIQGGIAESVASVSETDDLEIVGTGNAPSEFVEQPVTSTRDIMSKTFDVNVVLLSPFAAQLKYSPKVWKQVDISVKQVIQDIMAEADKVITNFSATQQEEK